MTAEDLYFLQLKIVYPIITFRLIYDAVEAIKDRAKTDVLKIVFFPIFAFVISSIPIVGLFSGLITISEFVHMERPIYHLNKWIDKKRGLSD